MRRLICAFVVRICHKQVFIFRSINVAGSHTDASSSKDGTGTTLSETSKDHTSEDLESAEESEKTQTTSDAESAGDLTSEVKGTVVHLIIM